MKICTKCNINKELSEFNKNLKNKKSGLSSYCKKCVNSYTRDHYEIHKEQYNKRQLVNRNEKRKWFLEIKSTLKCVKCGENHLAVLDFHHLNPNEKEFGISKFFHTPKEKILNEMKKCIVLCSNCHRKLHWEEKYLNNT